MKYIDTGFLECVTGTIPIGMDAESYIEGMTAVLKVIDSKATREIQEADEVVAFCNSKTAEELINDDSEIREALVISDLIPDTDAIVVKKQEFLDWLYEVKENDESA